MGNILLSKKKISKRELMKEKQSFLNVWQGLGLMLVFILLVVLIYKSFTSVAIWLTAKGLIKYNAEAADSVFGIDDIVAIILSLSIILFALSKIKKIALKDLILLKPIKEKDILPSIILFVGAYMLIAQLTSIIHLIWPQPESLSATFSLNNESWLWIFIGVAIVGPVVEEIFFRGILLQGFLKRYNTKTAIFFSGLFFGLYHMNIWQGIPTMFTGILLGWWVHKTDSIISGIIGHIAYNMTFLVLDFIISRGINIFPTNQIILPWWYNSLGLLLFGLGIWLSKKLDKGQEVKSETF